MDATDEVIVHGLPAPPTANGSLSSGKRNAHMANSLQSSSQRNATLQAAHGLNKVPQPALHTIPAAAAKDSLSIQSFKNHEMRDSRDGVSNHTAMNTATSGATRQPL
jgi:hypothetical protein